MGTIPTDVQTELTSISNSKSEIRNAIIAKGVEVPSDTPLSDYASKISNISGGSATLITKTIAVNGTYAASSDNADGYSSVTVEVPTPPVTGILVRVIDYDGTILKSERLEEGDTFTLPSQPSHTGLVFQEWVSPVTITNNTVTVGKGDINIGCSYTTSSGLSEFYFTLNQVHLSTNQMTINLNMDGTKDWGDGTTDDDTSHTYSAIGDYVITCDGTELYGVGDYFHIINETRIGSNVTYIENFESSFFISIPNTVEYIGMNSGSPGSTYLKSLTVPNGITDLTGLFLNYFYELESVVLPSSVETLAGGMFFNCGLLNSISIPEGVTTIPRSCFLNCSNLESISIPSTVTTIGPSAFAGCSSIKYINIPLGVTTIEYEAFESCSQLRQINIPSSVVSIGSQAFTDCISLPSISFPPNAVISDTQFLFGSCQSLHGEVIFPEGSITSLSYEMFNYCFNIERVKVPSTVTSVASDVFSYCWMLKEVDFTDAIAVPTLESSYAFLSDTNAFFQIKVPAALEAQWKSATNWSTIADHIIGV